MLVEPAQKAVFVYVLNEQETYIGLRPATQYIASPSFPDIALDLKKIF